MVELLAAEGPGWFGVERDGTFVFENRNYRTTAPRSTTSQLTLYDRIAGERTRYRAHLPYRSHRLYRGRIDGLVHTNLKPLNPLKNVYNRATAPTRLRAAAPSPVQVYQYGASLVLGANQARTLFVRPSDPFVGAVPPALGVDYQVTAGSASVSLTYTSGFLAIVRVQAGAGGATIDGVTSTGLQLRAQPLTVVSEATVENTVDASASIAKFSPIPGQAVPITLALSGWAEIDPAQAEAVCDAWVLRQQELRPLVSFTIQGNDAAHLEAILRLRESDRITIYDAASRIDGADFWVNAMKLRVAGAGGRTVELDVLAEACDSLSGAVWDRDLWNDSSAVWGV
jgi:hypothetical protein